MAVAAAEVEQATAELGLRKRREQAHASARAVVRREGVTAAPVGRAVVAIEIDDARKRHPEVARWTLVNREVFTRYLVAHSRESHACRNATEVAAGNVGARPGSRTTPQG